MTSDDFCHAWQSQFPNSDVPDIWVGDIRDNLVYHKAKVASLR